MIDTGIHRDPSNNKVYWEKVYLKSFLTKSGWYQARPESSLRLIAASKITKEAHIIDVGGGDSLLVDHLLDAGYTNVSVLDISERAIEKAKRRLGILAKSVNWICADVTAFESDITFDLWHDRACLHFLTQPDQVASYRKRVSRYLNAGGNLILGTFSYTGPEKCSGLPIHQYNAAALEELFSPTFELIESFDIAHVTPTANIQNYVFSRFKKK